VLRVSVAVVALLVLVGDATTSPGSTAGSRNGRIAFWSDRAGDPDVFTMNVDGSEPKNLGREGSGDKRASWSPDGDRLVFDSWFAGKREFDLWLMDPDGGHKQQLTTSPLRDVLPAWSPDGRWIAFTRKRANSRTEDLWLIRPDGTGSHMLTRFGSSPAWSPDSRRLVFASWRNGSADIYVIDRSGRNRTRLTRTKMDEGPSAGSWSPDGRKILFTRWPIGGFGDVFVMDVADRRVRRLTSSTSEDGDASWSPDGTQIVFGSTRDGNAEVYVMDADGSHQRNLTRSTGEDFADTWQPLRR
jgi:Tol biopolymer transport system component